MNSLSVNLTTSYAPQIANHQKSNPAFKATRMHSNKEIATDVASVAVPALITLAALLKMDSIMDYSFKHFGFAGGFSIWTFLAPLMLTGFSMLRCTNKYLNE